MLRCRFVLESGNVEKFFVYVELPNFDVASDASATFKVWICTIPLPSILGNSQVFSKFQVLLHLISLN